MALVPSSHSDDAVPAEPPTFMTIPAELRLKVYEWVFDEVKIDGPAGCCLSKSWGLENQFAVGKLDEYPWALLAVNKKIRQEAGPITSACPVVLVLVGMVDTLLLRTSLAAKLEKQICSIIADGSLLDCMDAGGDRRLLHRHVFPNLRHVDLRGLHRLIWMPIGVIKHLGTIQDAGGYQLPPAVCQRFREQWPPQWRLPEPLVECGQCDVTLSFEWTTFEEPDGEGDGWYFEHCVKGELLWTEHGMTTTSDASCFGDGVSRSDST